MASNERILLHHDIVNELLLALTPAMEYLEDYVIAIDILCELAYVRHDIARQKSRMFGVGSDDFNHLLYRARSMRACRQVDRILLNCVNNLEELLFVTDFN